MTDIQNLLAQPACRYLGWALLHFLWQGTLAALVLLGCNLAFRESRARVRYAVSCLFLIVLLALPLISFTAALIHIPVSLTTPAQVPVSLPAAMPLTHAPLVPARLSLADLMTPFLPWIVACWIAGVWLLSMRGIGAWAYLHRLRRAPSVAVPLEWARVLRDLLDRAAISVPVRLSVHWLAPVPCVIGWLRPVILMPAVFLTGLDLRALEALLAHELAHVRRYDYLVNLLQTSAETLLFYHPAVWWVSRQIRIERENCCDDFAAQLCGNRLLYAHALVDVAQIRAAEPLFALSARGGTLIQRIERLLRPGQFERSRTGWSTALAGAAMVVCLAVVFHPHVQAELTTPTASAAPSATPAARLLPAPHGRVETRMAVAPATPEPQAESGQSRDFLTGMVGAGFRNLTVEELIELKIHGVTPQFATAVRDGGFPNVTPRDLIDMAIHRVDADFLRGMKRNSLRNASIANLVSLRIHGVTPDYIAALRAAGYQDLTVDEYRQLHVHGVDAAFIRHLGESGIKNVSIDQLLRLKQSGF